MSESVISVRNLTKTYDSGSVRVEALKDVSLEIGRGEFVAIMGHSGSGKSTFLNLLGCLDTPTAGKYFLSGVDVASLSDDERALLRSTTIGFVFQSFNLLSRTTALENVELPQMYAGQKPDGILGRELIAAVGLPERWDHTPNQLSGGEQQRIALARALVNSPPLILADEPTGNLDTQRSAEIMTMLRSLNDAGMTIVLVTHEEDIASYAKRLIRFSDGRIISDVKVGGGISLLKSPRLAARNFIETGKGGEIAVETGDDEPGGAADDAAENDVGNGADAPIHGHAASAAALPAGLLDRLAANRDRRDAKPGRFAKVRANLKNAFRSLRQNPLRSALTALGILIGVAAVIAMVSIGQGTQVQVQENIESLGSNMITVMPGSQRTGMTRGAFGTTLTLKYTDADSLAKIPNVVTVAPELSMQKQIKYANDNWNTKVVGTTASYTGVKNWKLAEGAFFTEDDNTVRRNVAVVGSTVVTKLFGGASPVGKSVMIAGMSFRVTGVLETKGGSGFGNQDDLVLIPIRTATTRLTSKKNVSSISMSVSSKDDMPAVKEAITPILRSLHRLADGTDDDFTIMSQDDILKTVQGVTSTLTLLLASIAGISLVVGGIGIMNIMMVSVTERTREIGIRKAIGARRRDILWQFLTEAVILSGLGGILGWLLGAGAARVVSTVGNMRVSISPGTVSIAIGFSLLIGVFFGIYPARKAASMDPIKALRYE